MIFKKATRTNRDNLQHKNDNKTNKLEIELKTLKKQFEYKKFTYKALCMGSISLLVATSIFYDLIGDWGISIIFFLLSICLTLSLSYKFSHYNKFDIIRIHIKRILNQKKYQK